MSKRVRLRFIHGGWDKLPADEQARLGIPASGGWRRLLLWRWVRREDHQRLW